MSHWSDYLAGDAILYEGRRDDDDIAHVTVAQGGPPLKLRLDLANHSPTGFEWGYGGSGPAQLALAMLAHYLDDDDEALHYHQAWKWYCIAALPKDGWSLTKDEMAVAWYRFLEREQEKAQERPQ